MSKVRVHPKKAAVFDLDGTLVDSMPFVISAFIHAVEPYRPKPDAAEVLACLGGPLDPCLRNLLGPKAADHLAEARERLITFEDGKEADLPPFPGARELLASLKDRGVKLGVWTGRNRWSTERILSIHGLAGFFAAVVCGDDLPNHKPDPAGLIHAVKTLGVTPREVVFVGDADVDILAGHAAGIHTIFMHHGRAAPAHIHSKASEVFATPEETYPAVLSNFA
jgi:pyrophosphatase PpaX